MSSHRPFRLCLSARVAALLVLVLVGTWPAQAADTDELVGQAAPACTLPARAAFPAVDLSAYRGRVVYLDFWASWCSACVRSFPYMNDLVERYGDRGFAVIAITLDEDIDDAEAFLTRHPAKVVIGADPDANCARAFGLRAMPSSYIIDATQVVREAHLGFHPGRTVRMRETIESLLPLPALSSQ